MDSVIQEAKRVIIKVGSSLVTNDGKGLDANAIQKWAAQIAQLRALGKEVVLVSSGAIVEGCLLYTSPSPRDLSTSRMPSSA